MRITSPRGQKILNVAGSTLEARRLTAVGPGWVNGGKVQLTESVIGGGGVTCLDGGTWEGSNNVFDSALTPPRGETAPVKKVVSAETLVPGAGANVAEFTIPPRPVPHSGAGKFTTLAALDGK